MLKDVNLNIRQGEIYGLVGKNGAGKTMTRQRERTTLAAHEELQKRVHTY